MKSIETKFAKLGTNNAPGQEVRLKNNDIEKHLKGESLDGQSVDFSHGDVNGDAFAPTPHSLETFIAGVQKGGSQAYTEYRGDAGIRRHVAWHLAAFTSRPINAIEETIITPGTQGAVCRAIASTVAAGDKVAIVRPDYFANRKLVEFMDAEVVPVTIDYLQNDVGAGLDLTQLESAFKSGVRTFIFSNPNNPAGVVYSADEIESIADLANKYDVTVIVDQLYSRLLYPGVIYTHLRATNINPDKVLTIMGPSKTESLSGYRLGVAFGSSRLISRMEKLQAIVSLRAPGYSQAVLKTWFAEPSGWMEDRIAKHQAIRDDLLKTLHATPGVQARAPQAGSYLFPSLPELTVSYDDFVKILRLQAGVTVTPGTEFSPTAENCIRFNFSQNHAAAVHAVQRVCALIERYRA